MKLKGVGERQAKTYMQWVAEAEASKATQSDEEAYGHLINRTQVICTEALREGNLELANKLIQTEIKLIDSKKKQSKRGKVTHEAKSVFNPEPFSEDELVTFMDAFKDN